MCAHGNGCFQLFLSGRIIFAVRCNLGPQLVGARLVYLLQLRCNLLGLVQTAAHNAGRLHVEGAEVRECFGVVRIELDRGFKLLVYLLAKRECAEERCVAGPLTEGPAIPHVVAGILAVELNRTPACAGCGVKLPQCVTDAALQKLGLRNVRPALRQGPNQSQCLVGFAGLQICVDLGQRLANDLRGGHSRQSCAKQQSHYPHAMQK